MNDRRDFFRLVIIFAIFGVLAGLCIADPDWFSKTGAERRCEASSGSYFQDRQGHEICLAPGVAIKP